MSAVVSAPPAADRRGGWVRLVPTAAFTALSVGLAADSVSFREGAVVTGFPAGLVAALMAVFLLRSIPASWAARGVILLGAGMIVQFGQMSVVGAAPSARFLLWGVSTAIALVLAQRLESTVGAASAAGAAAGRTLLAATIAACAVAGGMLVAGPAGTEMFSAASSTGDDPAPEWSQGNSPLREPGVLDMTTRPRLTDRIVFTVKADRPSFWRTRTYDLWDGRSWAPTEPRRFAVIGDVQPAPFDLGATGGATLRQEFRLESDYADLLPAAATPVQVTAPARLAQTTDGDLAPIGQAFGRGATYTVTSRQPVFDETRLRAASGEIPDALLAAYAQPPRATERVRALAGQITQGIDSTYDKVLAIEHWMGRNTSYSLDAPLSPTGVDVVDHFLFDSRQGWCEQIASSLVVLLRLNGVPARLVTGYVAGDRDVVSGRYQVREQDAHAWAEVWFPGNGWVPFDPTAEVPFSSGTASAALPATELGSALLAIALVLMAGGPVWSLVTGLARRWRGRRSGRRRLVAGPIEARLERLGAAAGREREDRETLTAYARGLAEQAEDPRIAAAGEVADRARYSDVPPGDAVQRDVERMLDELIDASGRAR